MSCPHNRTENNCRKCLIVIYCKIYKKKTICPSCFKTAYNEHGKLMYDEKFISQNIKNFFHNTTKCPNLCDDAKKCLSVKQHCEHCKSHNHKSQHCVNTFLNNYRKKTKDHSQLIICENCHIIESEKIDLTLKQDLITLKNKCIHNKKNCPRKLLYNVTLNFTYCQPIKQNNIINQDNVIFPVEYGCKILFEWNRIAII